MREMYIERKSLIISGCYKGNVKVATLTTTR